MLFRSWAAITIDMGPSNFLFSEEEIALKQDRARKEVSCSCAYKIALKLPRNTMTRGEFIIRMDIVYYKLLQ